MDGLPSEPGNKGSPDAPSSGPEFRAWLRELGLGTDHLVFVMDPNRGQSITTRGRLIAALVTLAVLLIGDRVRAGWGRARLANAASPPDDSMAEGFGRALARRDYATAREMLTSELQRTLAAQDLEKEVQAMTAHALNSEITHVEVMNQLRVWPAKRPGDLLWVYVALTGDSFSEAVAVVLRA